MLLLLENNIRGGLSTVLGDRYIESSVGKPILYIDADSLYGGAMSQYLTTGEFEQITVDDLQSILRTRDNSDYG